MEPLEIAFIVGCSPDHAFAVWAERTSLWWPHGHSVSGAAGLTVTFEPHPGGRIYERTPAGEEHDWGELLVWEPPRRLVYLWHLRFDRTDATEVEVTFAPDPDDATATAVTIVHRGWEHARPPPYGPRGAPCPPPRRPPLPCRACRNPSPAINSRCPPRRPQGRSPTTPPRWSTSARTTSARPGTSRARVTSCSIRSPRTPP